MIITSFLLYYLCCDGGASNDCSSCCCDGGTGSDCGSCCCDGGNDCVSGGLPKPLILNDSYTIVINHMCQ